MRLPINFLLYTASLGLLGLSGWNVYKMLPSWKKEVRESAHNDGLKAGKDCLGKGRGTGRISDVWRYSPDTIPWWAMLKTANLVGKVPPPPPKPKGPDDNDRSKVPVAYVATPLEQMFELVSLVSDDAHDGKGGNSHVILRFRPDANVKPPEWWVRENTRPAVGAGMPGVPAMPADVTKGAQGNQATRPPANAPKQNPTQLRGTSSMPMSPMGSEILQKLWVNAAGDPRRAAEVWPMSPAAAVAQPGQPAPVLGTIRLVRVAEDAQSAFFVREFPKQGDAPPPEPKEEQLFKTSMNLPQDVLKALHALQGRSGPVPTASAQKPLAVNPNGVWQDVEVTTKVGNTVHIGRKDEQRFGDSEQFLDSLNVDTYVTKSGRKGLIVRQVEADLGASYGVVAGDVLLEVNGQKVESKAQAYSIGKSQYKQGVRTFVTKWLSNGQEVERVYQARDK